MIFDSFWGRLGVVLEPILGAKIDPTILHRFRVDALDFDLVIDWSQDGRQDRPKRAQEPPRAAQDPPRSPLGTVLEPSWDQSIARSKSRRFKTDFSQTPFGFWVDFGSPNAPQNDPKTTPKRVQNQDEKWIVFLSFLDPSWTGLEAILGPSWGQKSGSRLTFSNVF